MTYQLLVGIAAAFWALSMIACLLAFLWSRSLTPKRFIAAVILSVTALGIGYLGITHFHVTGSRTVNGQVQWRFDSRWFFIATIVISILTLCYTVWKRMKATHST